MGRVCSGCDVLPRVIGACLRIAAETTRGGHPHLIKDVSSHTVCRELAFTFTVAVVVGAVVAAAVAVVVVAAPALFFPGAVVVVGVVGVGPPPSTPCCCGFVSTYIQWWGVVLVYVIKCWAKRRKNKREYEDGYLKGEARRWSRKGYSKGSRRGYRIRSKK